MTIMEMPDPTGSSTNQLVIPAAKKTMKNNNQTIRFNSRSAFPCMVKLHFIAYRALCNKITDVGLSVINTVVRPEETFESYDDFGGYLRRFAPIDYTYTTCKRAVNKVSQVATGVELFNSEELKTNNQLQKEREVSEMGEELGKKTVYPQFCSETAKLVDDLFPKLIGMQMIHIPRIAEQSFFYTLWLPYRYLNHQIDRRTDYRKAMLDSGVFKSMSRWYWFLTSNFSNSLLCKNNVSPILNFEHVLLKICMKVKPKVEGGEQGTTLIDVVIASVAKSIEKLQECDEYLETLDFDSRREKFIERLEWHRKDQSLPPGVPNPRKVPLNVSNLEEKLDKAMYEYLDEISTMILDELAPKSFKNKFVHLVYWLEGKNGLVKLLSFLIGELGVKQVSDPHLFALAILTALGIEVADFELDGFGRDKMETIFKAGEKMIKHSLEEGISSSVVVDDFVNTGLKHSPESVEGIRQKKEAREQLEKVLCRLLYDGIKPESYRYSGGLKDFRKMMQKVPILGMATVLGNALYSTLHLSVAYYFRSKDQSQDTLSTYMFKSLWGKDYTKTLTRKTMELIYHPAWRLVALQLVHDVTNHLFNRAKEVHQVEQKSTNDHIRTVASFVFRHYTAEATVSLESLFSLLLSDEMIGSLKEMFSSPGKPFLETAMESILPTINEITLFIRVGEGFRKDAVYFDGDAKFWELYVREYLNRAVVVEVRKRYSRNERPNLEVLTSIRDEIVKQMLDMDITEVRKKLISLPKKIEINKKPQITVLQEFNESMVDWKYLVSDEENKQTVDHEEEEPLADDDFVMVRGDKESSFSFSE
jgi:hypothetical protein